MEEVLDVVFSDKAFWGAAIMFVASGLTYGYLLSVAQRKYDRFCDKAGSVNDLIKIFGKVEKEKLQDLKRITKDTEMALSLAIYANKFFKIAGVALAIEIIGRHLRL